MKLFLEKITIFISIIISLIIIGFILPPTPRERFSILFSQKVKDSLLKNTIGPRIIFIGGSNVSMGINSNIIKKELKLKPINTSIHASIGLKYMMNHALKHINKCDVIILSPEYQQFYDNTSEGGNELLRVICDMDKKEIFDLSTSQIISISKYLPSYSFSKFQIQEYFFDKKDFYLYCVDGYNEYGDYNKHWTLEPKLVKKDISLGKLYNNTVIKSIKEFENRIKQKGATLYLTFPGYQSSSFIQNEKEIQFIFKDLQVNKFNILGSPLRYMISDSLMHGTTYHLSQSATNQRTNLFIEDYKNFIILSK